MGNPSQDYKAVRRVGRWASVLLWLELILTPPVILAPYLINKNIKISDFVTLAIVNSALSMFLVVLVVIKGEVLKKPEKIPVSKIISDTRFMGFSILLLVVISLVLGGRFGFLWLIFLGANLQAMEVAQRYQKMGKTYITDQIMKS